MRRELAAWAKGWLAGERLIRRNPLDYPGLRAGFGHLVSAPAAERRQRQAALESRALAEAARTGYGRSVGAPRERARWPLLEPARVREAPRQFTRRAPWSIAAATGGTSGMPLPLWRSPRSVAAEQAALDTVLAIEGVDLARARVAVLRGDDIKAPDDREPPFWVSRLGGRRLVFSSNHLNRESARHYLRALAEFRADLWWVYPAALESLIRFGTDSGIRCQVPWILSSSEVLSPWCRGAAREAFGARIIDHYGQAERVAFAWSLEERGFRFLPGYSAVELLPAQSDSGARYEIVGTSLWNEAMPLVRYRTGDLIQTAAPLSPAELEEVALGLRPFDAVLGRDGDILIGPDGARLTGIDHFHRGVPHLIRIQVVQADATHVEILVVPAPGYGTSDEEQLRANARRKLPSSMAVEIRRVEALRRNASGKTPFVIREATAARQ
jgi:phenylacetate-CoA ligase